MGASTRIAQILELSYGSSTAWSSTPRYVPQRTEGGGGNSGGSRREPDAVNLFENLIPSLLLDSGSPQGHPRFAPSMCTLEKFGTENRERATLDHREYPFARHSANQKQT